MKIGFDVSQTAENMAGCGFVADQLIRGLARNQAKNHREFTYLLYPTFYSYRHPDFRKASNPGTPNCHMHFKGMTFTEMVRGWTAKMPDRSSWLGDPQVVHSNNFSCRKDHRARIVYTLYDLAFLVYPEYTPEENRVVCFDGLFNAGLYADHCLAISGYTKKKFLDFFPHYPEERVTVMPLGTRPGIKFIRDEAVRRKVLEKFGINPGDEFWLGVGTIQPRKNYRLLIDAFCRLKDGRKLLIAGGEGWLESDIGLTVKQMGMADNVKFLDYVSDLELSVLYSTCFAFVFPSYYEGFGLPVLEAMSCGAAVISSKTSSLPEVGGDAVVYIDPASTDDLIEKMKSWSGRPEERQKYRLAAMRQAAKFSWDDAAAIVHDVYRRTQENAPYFA